MNDQPKTPRRRPDKSTKVLESSSNKGMFITVGVLVVVAILVLGGIVWMAKKKDDKESPLAGGSTADQSIVLADDGSLTVGQKGAPTLDVWEDFMCPACGQFEKVNGDEISKQVQGGKLQVTYHMLNFLDRNSKSKKYSTRALAAMQCVARNENLKTFYDVKKSFFDQQPEEGGGDRTADELADTAKDAGAGTASVDCIKGVEDGDGMDRAKTTADQSQEALKKVTDQMSTPTVAHEGQVVQPQGDWLQKILDSSK